MSIRQAAMTETVLGGVPLPAEKKELLEYAEEQEPPAEVREALAGIPDREYHTLDEVAEEIAEVQPGFSEPQAERPTPESGAVPGGEAYTDPSHESGRVRGDPEILEYESQLVRVPGEDPPQVGQKAPRP